MPNPYHHPDNGQFTTPPAEPAAPPVEQAPPDPWASVREAGITPEQAMQGGRLYADLNNLDRRQQALQSVIRPDIDTWIGRQAEEEDPFSQFGMDDYDEPAQPQGLPFDPQEYARQIVELSTNQSLRQMQEWMQNLVIGQQFTEAASGAVSSHKLPPSDAAFIEQQARAIAQQQPNRAPADNATALAHQRANELAQWAQASGAMPPTIASPSTPGGPVPSLMQGPPPNATAAEIEAWAMARSKDGLR
jgi:hypothetical protein